MTLNRQDVEAAIDILESLRAKIRYYVSRVEVDSSMVGLVGDTIRESVEEAIAMLKFSEGAKE